MTSKKQQKSIEWLKKIFSTFEPEEFSFSLKNGEPVAECRFDTVYGGKYEDHTVNVIFDIVFYISGHPIFTNRTDDKRLQFNDTSTLDSELNHLQSENGNVRFFTVTLGDVRVFSVAYSELSIFHSGPWEIDPEMGARDSH